MKPIITKNQRTYYMDDINSRKVAQDNDLITSVAKMDKIPYKMFELAVSCIDTENPPKNNIIYLSKKELFTYFEVSDNDMHSRFKKAMKQMVKEAVFQTKIGKEEVVLAPISYVGWTKSSDEVTVEFGSRIMPYLVELKKNFTQYKISDIKYFQSKYSITLYKLICMYYNQYESYKFKNNRTKKQLYELQNPSIKVSELRRVTNTQNEYTRFGNFETFVIKTAVDEINKFTDLNIQYDKIKKGRSIAEIQFYIGRKINWKDEEYKRNDDVATLSIEQKQEKNDILFAQGIANTYTIKLLTANLITGLDMINQEMIIGLSKHVYPLYDEIVAHYGEKALSDHLGYVRDNMVDYTSSKKNIVKYLAVSAQQYLDNGVGKVVKEKKEQVAKEKTKRSKPIKKAPEWSNANYVDESTEEEKQRFAELQKNMRNENT